MEKSEASLFHIEREKGSNYFIITSSSNRILHLSASVDSHGYASSLQLRSDANAWYHLAIHDRLSHVQSKQLQPEDPSKWPGGSKLFYVSCYRLSQLFQRRPVTSVFTGRCQRNTPQAVCQASRRTWRVMYPCCSDWLAKTRNQFKKTQSIQQRAASKVLNQVKKSRIERVQCDWRLMLMYIHSQISQRGMLK